MTTPPDVLQMAREIVAKHRNDAWYLSGHADFRHEVQIAIAAIMAERERICAKLDEEANRNMLLAKDNMYDAECWSMAVCLENMTAAIRNTGGE